MIKKISALLLLLEAFRLTAQAATPSTSSLPTNFIQSISLQLVAVTPGKSTASSGTVSNLTITTKEAIKAIGQATANRFSEQAQ